MIDDGLVDADFIEDFCYVSYHLHKELVRDASCHTPSKSLLAKLAFTPPSLIRDAINRHLTHTSNTPSRHLTLTIYIYIYIYLNYNRQTKNIFYNKERTYITDNFN